MRFRQARHARRGGVLLIVLVAATAIAALSALILQMTSHYTRRQLAEEHDTRAFYVAEAGLSEAYHALLSGGTGQVASLEEPARFGDGLLWVTATELPEGRVQLDSTGLSGMGRSALTLVVERLPLPPGVFSDGDFQGVGEFLIDGYSSRVGTYESQVIDPELLSLQGVGSLVTTTTQSLLAPLLGPLLPGGLLPGYSGTPISGFPGVDPDDIHTVGGGTLASNGDIRLQGAIRVYGDAAPGPGDELVLGGGALVTGLEQPGSEDLDLDAVLLPGLTLQPDIDHGVPLPLVLPPVDAGYASLLVRAGAQVIVRGPCVLQLGSLALESGSALTVDNVDGRVDLYVGGPVDLAPGSQLEVLSSDPARLTLQVAGLAQPVRLAADSRFHGVLYAPQAAVELRAPFELFGMLIAGSLSIGDGARLHCDFGLEGEAGPLALPRMLSWRVVDLPPEVRARNSDPAQLLGVDPLLLPVPLDALETYSWTARVSYVNQAGSTVEYRGPFEAFEAGTVNTYLSFVLEPPTVSTPTPWTLELSYLDATATPQTYSGDAAGFNPTGLTRILAIVMSPPTLLEALGLEPIARIFP